MLRGKAEHERVTAPKRQILYVGSHLVHWCDVPEVIKVCGKIHTADAAFLFVADRQRGRLKAAAEVKATGDEKASESCVKGAQVVGAYLSTVVSVRTYKEGILAVLFLVAVRNDGDGYAVSVIGFAKAAAAFFRVAAKHTLKAGKFFVA